MVSYGCYQDIAPGLVYLHINGSVGTTYVPLTWNPIPAETSYTVYMKLATDPVTSFASVATVTGNTSTITGLVTNTTYDFYIEGVGTSNVSIVIRVTTA